MYLLAGDVLATWAVGLGILWEAKSITVSHKMAGILVFWGVVLETVCSVALFTFDEGISQGQQSTIEGQKAQIIVLEQKLAPRTLTVVQQEAIRKVMAAPRIILLCFPPPDHLRAQGWLMTSPPHIVPA